MIIYRELVDKILANDKRSISRAISLVENEEAGSTDLLKLLFKYKKYFLNCSIYFFENNLFIGILGEDEIKRKTRNSL